MSYFIFKPSQRLADYLFGKEISGVFLTSNGLMMNAGVPEGVAEALSRGKIFFEKDAGHLFRKEISCQDNGDGRISVN